MPNKSFLVYILAEIIKTNENTSDDNTNDNTNLYLINENIKELLLTKHLTQIKVFSNEIKRYSDKYAGKYYFVIKSKNNKKL